MLIGKRIEALRKEHNLSQRQLAEAMGVSRKAVSRWESGESEPDNVQLVLMARILGIETQTLLRGTDHADVMPKITEQDKEETEQDPEAAPAPEVQIVEKIVERVRVVEKPVIEYVEKPVVKKVVRVKNQRNPIEFAIVGGVCFLLGLLIGILL